MRLQDCSTWSLEDNGQLRRGSWETWSKMVWFPIELVPGLKKVMNSCSKWRRLYLGNGYFSLWSLNILNLTIGILISNNQFLIVPLD
jgi:hypothetical protein